MFIEDLPNFNKCFEEILSKRNILQAFQENLPCNQQKVIKRSAAYIILYI